MISVSKFLFLSLLPVSFTLIPAHIVRIQRLHRLGTESKPASAVLPCIPHWLRLNQWLRWVLTGPGQTPSFLSFGINVDMRKVR